MDNYAKSFLRIRKALLQWSSLQTPCLSIIWIIKMLHTVPNHIYLQNMPWKFSQAHITKWKKEKQKRNLKEKRKLCMGECYEIQLKQKKNDNPMF